MPECQRSRYKDWKCRRKKNLCLLTYSLILSLSMSNSATQTSSQSPLILTPVQQLEAGVGQTQRNRLTIDKVTGRKTSRLSSYLCTPSGSQRRIHWCQTGRSSTGCWTCCSAVGELLYLYYTIYRRQLRPCLVHIPGLSPPKTCGHVQHTHTAGTNEMMVQHLNTKCLT